MPAAVATTLVGDIYDALSPRGVFVVYQLRRTVVDRARPLFGTPAARMVLLNAPPLQLFRWEKDARDRANRSW